MKRKCLAVGIILLFVGVAVAPSINSNAVEIYLPTSTGNWLYVGGSGSGNYTSIQEAINNASDGDTVFVYDDSAPYREIFTIDRSITLTGENRNSTIINGTGRNLAVITITVEHITVQGFTVFDSDPAIGVMVNADNTTISNLWVRNIQNGIIIEPLDMTTVIKNCLIHENVIEGANIGLYTEHALNVTLSNNLLRDHDAALALFDSFHCIVSSNLIKDSYLGMSSYGGAKNKFTGNTITACTEGVDIDASNDQVINNNFLNVTRAAYFYRHPWVFFNLKSEAQLYPEYEFNHIFLKEYLVLGRSVWRHNYWNEPRTKPYPIPGWRGDLFIDLSTFYHFPPNRLAFDLIPAQEPFDIPIVPS